MYGMLSFPLFFVYRTVILANSSVFGQYFNKRNLLVTFVVIFVFCCLEGACLYYSNIPYEDLFEKLNKTSKVLQHFEKQWQTTEQPMLSHAMDPTHPAAPNHHNVSGVIPVADDFKRSLPLTGDDYSRNPLILYFHGIAVVSHGLSYLIILVSAHIMMKNLKDKQATMSLDTFVANEVLVHAVFAEAFLPLLLAVPVAANALLTTFYENSLEWQEFLPMYCISLVPLLSPIISICFIKAYRKTMLSFITLGFLRTNKKKKEEDQKSSDDNIL
ncbi:hypothetical protein Aduo_015544 [Ancylostoma duodenale]